MIIAKINNIRVIPGHIFEAFITRTKSSRVLSTRWISLLGPSTNSRAFTLRNKTLENKIFIAQEESYKSYHQLSEIAKLYPELPTLFDQGMDNA